MTKRHRGDPSVLADQERQFESMMKGCKDCANLHGQVFEQYVCKIDKAPTMDGYCHYRKEVAK